MAVSFGITDGTLKGDSGAISGVPVPSHTSADHETEDSDVMIVATTLAPECTALAEIPIPQWVRDIQQAETTPWNVFKVTVAEQDQAVSTIKSMMRHDDKDKNLNSATGLGIAVLAMSLTAVTPSRNALPFKLGLSLKELKCLQEIVATDVRMEHLREKAAQEGTDLPTSQDLPSSQESFGKAAAIQLEFSIEGLVLLAGNATVDAGDKKDGKVNKEYLWYDFAHGQFPLKPTIHDASWSREA